MTVAASAVLKPYGAQKPIAFFWRLLLVGLLIFVSAFYGLLSAAMPMSMIMVPATPIFILAALCLWLLPDIGGVYTDTYERLLLIVIGLHIIWPPYIALNLPGLPWISPLRVFTGVLAAIFLVNLASSAEMRRLARDSMSAMPAMANLFWAFWALTTLTLFLSSALAFSFTKYFNNQIYWTLMFFIAAVVARKPGYVGKAMTLMFIAVLPTAIAAIFEYQAQRVLWVPYIPSWLWGKDDLAIELISKSTRAGVDGYRVRGTTTVPLYYAQYLAMTFPIGLFLFTRATQWRRKGAILAALMLYAVAMFLTGSRTAMAGLLVAVVTFVFLNAWWRRIETPNALMPSATIIAYPAILAVVAAVVLLWRRAYVMIIGGGQHQASNDARAIQWQMGGEIFKRNPFGHGAGMSGDVLGYTNPGGQYTVDSYFLTIMLDYGVLALPLFVAMFIIPIYFAFRGIKRPYRDPEIGWLVPIGISLMIFVIIASALSTESNFSMAFVMLGFAVALIGRARAEDQPETAPIQASAELPAGIGR